MYAGLPEKLLSKREAILAIAKRHGVGRVRVFESFARGEQRADSDLDLLIDVTGQRSSWFPGGLVADLEDLLGRPVDIGQAEWMRPRVRAEVIAEALEL